MEILFHHFHPFRRSTYHLLPTLCNFEIGTLGPLFERAFFSLSCQSIHLTNNTSGNQKCDLQPTTNLLGWKWNGWREEKVETSESRIEFTLSNDMLLFIVIYGGVVSQVFQPPFMGKLWSGENDSWQWLKEVRYTKRQKIRKFPILFSKSIKNLQ